VVATQYAESEGIYTGDLDGELVWGEGKLRAVKAWAEARGVDLSKSAAYSDSWFDSPLLSAVGRPFAVNPDPRLAAAAIVRGWPVRFLDAPRGVPRVLGVEPFDLVRQIVRPELHPYARFDISGVENIPRKGAAIVVVNHRSYFDPAVIAMALGKAGRNGRFLAKKEVTDAPLLGSIVKAFGTIRVDRGSGSAAPMDSAREALRGGEVVVILPEGTIPRGEAFFDPVLVGRPGAARLAAELPEVPVIPIGLWNTEAVWPRSSKVPNVLAINDPPLIEVCVGAPIVLQRKLKPKAIAADTVAIMATIADLLPSESRQVKRITKADLARTIPSGKSSEKASPSATVKKNEPVKKKAPATKTGAKKAGTKRK
jgi:putative phosphoserine phosphatase / 1-acylglycerol-3-phosphate O-acyltransferase